MFSESNPLHLETPPPFPEPTLKSLNASACVDVLKGAAGNRGGGDEKS